jgi:exodeoxyribonuclease VII small subunit
MAARARSTGSDDGTVPPFEAALERLEAIVGELSDGELDLETSLRRFEEGVSLSRQCARQLEAARQRVEVLVQEEGELVERLFEPAGDADAPDGEAS